jgi:hypothetical protein
MKTKFFVILIVILLTITGITIVNADKPEGKGNGANKIDLHGFHYTLNILGKKSDWSGGGDYNNPDRSTIFVPQDTSDFSYTLPNGETYNDIAIYFAKGKEFAILDGNAFDGDGSCSIELPDKKFSVWICSRAKPGYTTDIDGMVYVEDTAGGWYLYCIGEISVNRKWQDAYDLFWVTWDEDYFSFMLNTDPDMWIFDYLDFIEGQQVGVDPDTGEPILLEYGMYFWDFDNNGNKLIKVRFYPI